MTAALITIVTSSFIFFDLFGRSVSVSLSIISVKTKKNGIDLVLIFKIQTLYKFALAVKWASGFNF